jgi:AsmA family protein
LQIRTAPKHLSIGSIAGPLNISGTLKHPRILPSAQTVARAGIAGALAALLPPLAVLPTIQFGTADHHRCDALLLRARQVAPGTKPPAPRRR